MSGQFSRTSLLYGAEAMERFAAARVAVFGIGGVGGYVVEALARSGIGALDIIDDDRVCLSNINRQIIATTKTVGRYKVDVAEERILDINPDCMVRIYKTFFLPETQDQFDFSEYDYVVDAIDTVTGKLAIIEKAKKEGTPVISSMRYFTFFLVFSATAGRETPYCKMTYRSMSTRFSPTVVTLIPFFRLALPSSSASVSPVRFEHMPTIP